MKRIGTGVGIVGLLLLAVACSDDAVTPGGGTGGSSAGASTTGGAGAGGAAAGSGGAAAGSGNVAGSGVAGGGSGGMAGGSGGVGGSSAGSAGAAGAGGSGGGAATCETKLGKAIKFAEKKKDMVAGDLGADATFADKPRTIELWAKFASANSWTAEQSILEIGKPSAPDNGNNVFGIDMSGRKGAGGVFGPYTHGCSDNNGTGAPPFLDNTAPDVGWLHLSWAYDPTKADATKRLEFTVNGNVLPTEFNQGKYDATGGKLVGNTGFVLLGASQNFGNEGWEGAMDEVRLWSVYRSPQQIKDNMKVIVKPNTAGLIAYYQFNEADAANVADATGNAAHKLAACAAAGNACPSANEQAPTFVDSDIPGPFTCGQ